MNIKIKRIIVRIFDKSIKTNRLFKFMVILSALYGLFLTGYNFLMLFFKDIAVKYITGSQMPDTFYFYKENLLFFASANRIMYLICMLAGLSVLYGCHLLFRGYKWGLLFYTVAKAFQIFTPVFFMGHRAWAVGDIMIVMLFLVFYYRYCFTHNIEKQYRKYNNITSPQQDRLSKK